MLKFTDFIIDCPDPLRLGRFYADLMGLELTPDSTGDWANIHCDGFTMSFQKVANYQRPKWPGQEHPQQFHLDFQVDAFEPEQLRVIRLGATLQKNNIDPSGYGWQVYIDPAGHPFCLCRDKPQ